MTTASSLLTPPAAKTVPQLPPECLPNYDLMVTEDDTPVDSLFCERQAKLLTDVIYCSWPGPGDERPFLCMSNVGLFFAVRQPPVVPDFLLSLDVAPPDNPWPKENRSYFVWNYGKFPDLVLEFVSNTEGGEGDIKLRMYAKMGIPYYVIFDPLNQLRGGVLRVLNLRQGAYVPVAADWLPDLRLGLTLWNGEYAGVQGEWLRWCDDSGRLLPTAEERADQEQQRADQEQQRADSAEHRATALAAQLRALGVDPAG